jgi:hypothetical protein
MIKKQLLRQLPLTKEKNMEKKAQYIKYVSPIPFPPEVEAEIARAPKRGTPERAAWVDNLREQAWKEGLRRFTTDELLVAMERERAGYDGLGELWGCTPTQTQT